MYNGEYYFALGLARVVAALLLGGAAFAKMREIGSVEELLRQTLGRSRPSFARAVVAVEILAALLLIFASGRLAAFIGLPLAAGFCFVALRAPRCNCFGSSKETSRVTGWVLRGALFVLFLSLATVDPEPLLQLPPVAVVPVVAFCAFCAFFRRADDGRVVAVVDQSHYDHGRAPGMSRRSVVRGALVLGLSAAPLLRGGATQPARANPIEEFKCMILDIFGGRRQLRSNPYCMAGGDICETECEIKYNECIRNNPPEVADVCAAMYLQCANGCDGVEQQCNDSTGGGGGGGVNPIPEDWDPVPTC